MEALPIVGGLISSNAAGNAADSQAASSAAGIAEQRRQFDLVRGDTSTARGVGESALLRYARELGIDYGPKPGTQSVGQTRAQLLPQFTQPATQGYWSGGGGREGDGNQTWVPGTAGAVDEAGLSDAITQSSAGGASNLDMQPWEQTPVDPTKEPGYQFGLQQGQTALDRRIAAMGGRVSGAAIKASNRYNQDYAQNGYAAAYNRQNSARSERLNRLAALAGMGQTAAATSGQTGQATSNAISGMLTSQGDNRGNAQLAQGNIWGNAFNQVAANYKTPNPLSAYSRYGTTGGANTMGYGGEY